MRNGKMVHEDDLEAHEAAMEKLRDERAKKRKEEREKAEEEARLA